jgi:hypothetical protein
MAIEAICSCGKKFRAKNDYVGRRAICSACHREFRFPVPSALLADQSPVQPELPPLPPPLPAPPTIDATLNPDRPVQSSRPARSRRVLIGGSALAMIALSAFGYLVWLRLSAVASLDDHDYRICLLKIELTKYRDDPKMPYEPLEKLYRESRENYTRWAQSMPPGDEGLNLLADASKYFEGNFFDIWISCLTTTYDYLGKNGIMIEPKDVLRGSLEVMRCWGPAALKSKVQFRAFGAAYERRRLKEGMNHRAAINDMMLEVTRFSRSDTSRD